MYYILRQDFKGTQAIDIDIPRIWVLNDYKLFTCKQIESDLPLITFYLNKKDTLPDLLPNEKGYLLWNKKLRDIIDNFATDPIQYLKVFVKYKKENKLLDDYLLANILTEVDAIDYSRFTFEYDHNGNIKFVRSLSIDETKAKNHAIFRPKDLEIPVVMNEELVECIKRNDCKGMIFIKPEDYRL